ncbi:MAG: hypothetical protein IE927_06975 [Rhodobacterales bacterium]|nr:hypothetical protein [Rhodobacterales bacterium]
MKKFTALVACTALVAGAMPAFAAGSVDQLTVSTQATAPVGFGSLAGAGVGVTAGTIIATAIVGTLLVVTIANDDGTTTTTTQLVP